ncbi:NAD(P)-dependent oxidoreductase [Rhizobium johnstonii]|uniref:NAD-dependent epimerase/dehydratase family protein n=1 Tax=Rhizobium johnstonii TaxID=3019933 RepID=UPI002DDD1D97|nr:NAD(P)-dependent oxidoreductase [Rhizobium johnstonii]
MTGAAGNVGRLLRPLLSTRYELKVTDIVDCDVAAGELRISGDLTDRDFCDFAVHDVDGVLHLAGLVGPDYDFEQTLDPNYRAVLNLLDACRDRAVGRFVFASSHHAVGMLASNAILDETAPIAPDSYYGLSKAFGEAACGMYARRFGIRTTLLRIGNADPLVVDGRRERLWTSARDMVSLIEIGLEHPDVLCDVVYAVSYCPDGIFENRRAQALGYQPKDNARDNRAPAFMDRAHLPPDQISHVGGYFAVNELPKPSGGSR